MSLRFERKGSLRVPNSSNNSSGSKLEAQQREDDYLKTWSYRQCQFACDYLNLMDPPKVRERAKLEEVFENVKVKNGAGLSSKNSSSANAKTAVGGGSSVKNSTISMSSRGSTSTWSSRASTVSSASSGISSIGNYYGELLDLGFELELEKVFF